MVKLQLIVTGNTFANRLGNNLKTAVSDRTAGPVADFDFNDFHLIYSKCRAVCLVA